MAHLACILGGIVAGAATLLFGIVILAVIVWERLK